MKKLEIKNLTKSYNSNTKVLDNISLSVEKGDIFGILGLSGAGKSTLVRCINGLENYEEGEIYLDSRLLSSKNKKIDRNDVRKIAMIFQHFNLLDQKDVLHNVSLALEVGKEKYTKDERTKLSIEALKLVGLENKLKAYPSELSGGQAQRVAIARALVLKPEILLCDEATSALDPETTLSILHLLKDLNEKLGLTIIMISHQMNAIEEICNKVAIIDKAKIIEVGALADVFLSPNEKITKNLIYSTKVHTELNDNKLLRILFNGNIDEPLISNIVEECHILVSIIYADSKVVNNKVYGQTIIKCPEKDKELIKLKKYLDFKKISYEVISND